MHHYHIHIYNYIYNVYGHKYSLGGERALFIIINSANFNLLKESKNLSTIRDVLFEEINLCQYILVHWKRIALVIYNMNIIKNVLVRVVHMLQDINTLMQGLFGLD